MIRKSLFLFIFSIGIDIIYVFNRYIGICLYIIIDLSYYFYLFIDLIYILYNNFFVLIFWYEIGDFVDV